MKSITPAGHTWEPVRIECPCGIDRMDCDYHKPDTKRKPISIKKLTTEDIDLVINHAIQKKSTLTTVTLTSVKDIVNPELFAAYCLAMYPHIYKP